MIWGGVTSYLSMWCFVPGVEGFCMLFVPVLHLEVSNERVDVPGFLEHTRSCMLPCMTAVEQAFIKCSTGVMSIMVSLSPLPTLYISLLFSGFACSILQLKFLVLRGFCQCWVVFKWGQILVGYQPRNAPTYLPVLRIFKELGLVYDHSFQKIWKSERTGQRTSGSLLVLSWKLLVL